MKWPCFKRVLSTDMGFSPFSWRHDLDWNYPSPNNGKTHYPLASWLGEWLKAGPMIYNTVPGPANILLYDWNELFIKHLDNFGRNFWPRKTACVAGSKGGGLGGSSASSARKGEAVYKLQSPQAEPVNPSSHAKLLQTHFLPSKVFNCLPGRLEHVEFNKPKVTIYHT